VQHSEANAAKNYYNGAVNQKRLQKVGFAFTFAKNEKNDVFMNFF